MQLIERHAALGDLELEIGKLGPYHHYVKPPCIHYVSTMYPLCNHLQVFLPASPLALFPRPTRHRWCGGRRLFDRLQGWAVQSGHEPDRFGFWAVEELVDVRWPPRRRGRQLEALLRFCGCDPVSRAEWPMEWMPITWLKDDLKAVARRMEAEKVAAAAAAAATHVTGRKRSWAGLGWDGADEGLPRRGRSAGSPHTGQVLHLTARLTRKRRLGSDQGLTKVIFYLLISFIVFQINPAGRVTRGLP